VHLLAILQAKGLTLAAAVGLGALIGPAQVAARVGELAGRGRHHPIWTLAASVALLAFGLFLLASNRSVAALALLAYGGGNGLFSIARGTLPLAFFGLDRYPLLMGRLARPHLLAKALAPFLAAWILLEMGAQAMTAVLAGLALANIALAYMLWRLHPTPPWALS
jgi:hypothetical protein